MDELLNHLEMQIKELIDKHHELKKTNQSLNQGKYSLSNENSVLLAKQQKAISQIEMLVNKLKAEKLI